MVNTQLISEHELLVLTTQVKLRKLIQREKQGWQNVLHKRVGFGLTADEFAGVVNTLENCNWVSCSNGGRGGVLIKFNETFKDINVPQFQDGETQ